MKLKYNGRRERVFATLGITVRQGDEFDAPEGFSHPDCKPVEPKSQPKPPAPITPSAASDLTVGDE